MADHTVKMMKGDDVVYVPAETLEAFERDGYTAAKPEKAPTKTTEVTK